MTTWRTVPFRSKEGTEHHDSKDEAMQRARRIANKTGDWVCVEDQSGAERPLYVHPSNKRR